ncbi:MAG: O-antigen ligase family protein [Thermoanaerobaculia bacterium]
MPAALRSPLALPAALLALWVVLSALASSDLRISTRHLPGLSLFLLLPIAMDLVDSTSRGRAIVLALGGSGCALSLLGFWQYLHDRGSDINERIQGTLSHWMTFSGLAMIAACLLAGLAFEERGRWRLIGLASVVPICAMLLTYTRGVWVGALAALVLYLAVRRPRGLLLIPPALFAVFFLLPPEIRGRMRSIGDPSDPTSRDRIAMARAGLRMVADHPLFGLGPDMVKPSYLRYSEPDAVRPVVPHLHNNLLQIAAANGLPASAAYLALVGVFLLRTVSKLRHETDPGRAALLAGALLAGAAITVSGLFEYNFGDTEVEMATLLVMSIPFSALFGPEAA